MSYLFYGYQKEYTIYTEQAMFVDTKTPFRLEIKRDYEFFGNMKVFKLMQFGIDDRTIRPKQ